MSRFSKFAAVMSLITSLGCCTLLGRAGPVDDRQSLLFQRDQIVREIDAHEVMLKLNSEALKGFQSRLDRLRRREDQTGSSFDHDRAEEAQIKVDVYQEEVDYYSRLLSKNRTALRQVEAKLAAQ
jgi:hypothetical protein